MRKSGVRVLCFVLQVRFVSRYCMLSALTGEQNKLVLRGSASVH